MRYLIALLLLSIFQVYGNPTSLNHQNLNLNRWMSLMPDNIKLSKMLIPGSHDSGALGNYMPGHTQKDSISGQLANGLRFFDIRLTQRACSSPSGCWEVVHGDLPGDIMTILDLRFGDFDTIVWRPVQSFLHNNPHETVLMSVRHETGDMNKALFMQTYGSQMLKYVTKDTQLGHVRGKVVFFDRLDVSEGIPWDESHNQVRIQDQYELNCEAGWWHPIDNYNCTRGLERKWAAISHHINRAQNESNYFWINFASATRMPLGTMIDNNAAYQNEHLKNLITDNNYATVAAQDYGSIFLMDYASGLIGGLLSSVTANYAEKSLRQILQDWLTINQPRC